MTESDKMKRGQWYDANHDSELLRQRRAAEALCFAFNHTSPDDAETKARILKELIPDLGEGCEILSPFLTDYGCYCHIGDHTSINHGAYLMDGGSITIGRNCFIGPGCGFYTAAHPLLAEDRNRGLEQALPIRIGDHCWLGGNVTVLPGVTIGSDTVIGAGSVVTKDIPDHVVAAGNPCRVLRHITEHDKL